MEDLIPFLIFVVIAAVNLIKFIAEKSAKSAPPANGSKKQPDKTVRKPSSIEEFFEEITQRLGPAPREMPDWPEEIERPDYVKEMEAYETGRAEKKPEPAAIVPAAAKPAPAQGEPIGAVTVLPEGPAVPRTIAFRMTPRDVALSGMSGMRISSPPLLRSAAGTTRFELNSRSQLKQALIASMIFGPPRAYDKSFDNTVM